MAAIKSQHSRLLEGLIAMYRQKLIDSLLTGVSESLYHQLVGEVRGLDAAMKMSEQADYKLSGDFDEHGA